MGTLLIGTDKGGYRLDGAGTTWEVTGTSFPGWRVTAWGQAADGTYLAGTASGWFGPGVSRSTDLEDWVQVEEGPAFPDDGPSMEQIWSFTTAPGGRVWCGTAEAGLFTSDDHGLTWAPVEGFNAHPTRPQWGPGAGGMCLHRSLVDGDRVWAAASAIGVFRSDDGGQTFATKNDGVGMVEDPGTGARPEVGYCVHAMTADPDDPDRMWQQNHSGVYRSVDGGDSWTRIEEGLPGSFGFPIVRDHASGALFLAPLEADRNRTPVDGDFAVWRSTDDGDSWHRSGTGWPDVPVYDSVLRGAMTGDGEGTVALASTGGQVWVTADAGDTWTHLPHTFPRVNAVALLP